MLSLCHVGGWIAARSGVDTETFHPVPDVPFREWIKIRRASWTFGIANGRFSFEDDECALARNLPRTQAFAIAVSFMSKVEYKHV